MKPKPGKSKEDFLDECMLLVLEDGSAEDDNQASAMCNTMWDEERSARESRVVTLRDLRAEGGESPKIVGYVANFNSLSLDLGGFIEQIRPGAFARTIRESDIRALWQHNPEYVLGRTRNNTLVLIEDETGLRVEITPPNTQWARDAVESIARGDVDQASFQFEARREEWNWNVQPPVRTLVDVELFDVSPVTFPAYPATSLAVRSLIREKFAGGQAPDADVVEAARKAQVRRALRRKELQLLESKLRGEP